MPHGKLAKTQLTQDSQEHHWNAIGDAWNSDGHIFKIQRNTFENHEHMIWTNHKDRLKHLDKLGIQMDTFRKRMDTR